MTAWNKNKKPLSTFHVSTPQNTTQNVRMKKTNQFNLDKLCEVVIFQFPSIQCHKFSFVVITDTGDSFLTDGTVVGFVDVFMVNNSGKKQHENTDISNIKKHQKFKGQ